MFYIKFCLSILKFNAPSATENLFNYLAKKKKAFSSRNPPLQPCLFYCFYNMLIPKYKQFSHQVH